MKAAVLGSTGVIVALSLASCGGGSSEGGSGGQSGHGDNGAVAAPTVDCPTFDNVMDPPTNFGQEGICGEVGEATATETAYDGIEDFVIWGEQGLGLPVESWVCQVRFQLVRVGSAPSGCAACTHTWLLEYRAPQVVRDVNGACAASSFGLSAARLAEIDGCRVAFGHDPTCAAGHGECRWKYSAAAKRWIQAGLASFDRSTQQYSYSTRATCTYR